MPKKLLPVILIAESDPAIRCLVRDILEQDGFLVKEVGNGCDVIPTFKQLIPDLVILDMNMPDLDGSEACRQIRGTPAGLNVPVIMMIGIDDQESFKTAYISGATDFIAKPIQRVLMSHRVHFVIRSSKTMKKLQFSEARLLDAQIMAKLGSWEMDLVSGKIQCSDEVYSILGWVPDGQSRSFECFMNAIIPGEKERIAALMKEALKTGSNFSFECSIVATEGIEKIIHCKARINRDEKGEANWIVGFFQDISERRRAEEEIRRLAYYDTLTGLANRTMFSDYFNHAVSFAMRTKTLIAILFVDLDRFKLINDSLGHSAGDKVLKEVAERLRASVRKYDYIAREVEHIPEAEITRFAGDEFLMLLKNVRNYHDVGKVVQRIHDSLSAPYMIDDTEIIITTSIGISIYPIDGENMEDLIKYSDIAMYHAKRQGRNTFKFYSQCLDTSTRNHLELEGQLRKAIKRKELLVCYQPIFRAPGIDFSGIETMVRWQHPQLGLLCAERFLPLAEETGIITEIDEWVLAHVCRQIRIWQDRKDPFWLVSVNISSQNFKKRSILDMVRSALETTGIDPRWLKLEITEGVLLGSDPYVVTALESLHEMGIRLALDDFGTGCSSLSCLNKFPVDTVKIDVCFIRDILTDSDCAAITSAIIALSRSLKLETIAEGVETKEQMEALLRMGCGKMQGNYFSPPLMLAELEQFRRETMTSNR